RRPFPWGKLLAWGGLVVLLFLTLFPFYWMLRTAFTFPTAVFRDTNSLLLVEPTLINFRRVLGMLDVQTAVELGGTGQSINFFLALRNSIIVSVIIVAGQVTFCAMAAYAFARLQFPLRNQIFAIYIAALMVPAIVMTIPNFVLIRGLGWLNTFAGIVAPTFLMTPFAVFFLRQFFLGINREVEEAALIDGADVPTVFFRVVLPMTVPALTTLAVITFITSWNNYMWPLIVGNKESVRVLTVALGVFRSQTPQGAPDWTGLMAGTTMAIIPTFILFLFAGRKILDSIQFTGFK
ncbi:MAG: carbohydrate ABC transporter permease, partial [Anaerolineae bacterium]